MSFYSENAENFINSTVNLDVSNLYNRFETYLPESGSLLDIGFGSGRDSLYFSKKYKVTAIDNCEEFVENGKKLGINAQLIDVLKMNDVDKYDVVWACASLLHLQKKDLKQAFQKIYSSMKKNGVFYFSFKYGDFEGIRTERYYTDLTENSLLEVLDKRFVVLEQWISEDVRPDKIEKWLNVIVKK